MYKNKMAAQGHAQSSSICTAKKGGGEILYVHISYWSKSIEQLPKKLPQAQAQMKVPTSLFTNTGHGGLKTTYVSQHENDACAAGCVTSFTV